MFDVLDKIDKKLRERVERVANIALRFGDNGVVEWAQRATNDALFLGKLRDRDVENLQRLEDTYSHDFYRGNTERGASTYVYA